MFTNGGTEWDSESLQPDEEPKWEISGKRWEIALWCMPDLAGHLVRIAQSVPEKRFVYIHVENLYTMLSSQLTI